MKSAYFVSYIAVRKDNKASFFGNATIYIEELKNNDDLLKLQKIIIEENKDIEIEEVCVLYWRKYEA